MSQRNYKVNGAWPVHCLQFDCGLRHFASQSNIRWRKVMLICISDELSINSNGIRSIRSLADPCYIWRLVFQMHHTCVNTGSYAPSFNQFTPNFVSIHTTHTQHSYTNNSIGAQSVEFQSGVSTVWWTLSRQKRYTKFIFKIDHDYCHSCASVYHAICHSPHLLE